MFLRGAITSYFAGAVASLSLIVASACGGSTRVDGTSAGTAGRASAEAVGGISNGTAGDSSTLAAGGSPAGAAGDSSMRTTGGSSAGAAGGSSAGTAGVSEPGAGSGGALNCAGVICNSNCQSGQFLKRVAGSCCSVCTDNPPECTQVEADYQKLVGELSAPLSVTSCATDADCTLLQHFPSCGDDCPSVPVNAVSVTELNAELKQWADTNCAKCEGLHHSCPRTFDVVCDTEVCVRHNLF